MNLVVSAIPALDTIFIGEFDEEAHPRPADQR
jgi:hypothetical protein